MRARWRAWWARAGATGDADAAWDRLVAAWSSPGRHYHTLAHLADCLRELDRVGRNDVVEGALFFHDAVYDPARHDNEERSADLAAELVPRLPLRPSILATRHDAVPPDDDARLTVDCDLAILGASPERYDRFERDVRAEYAFVPEDLFRAGRAAILRGFLARPRIYGTDAFRDRYEAAARLNLARAIAAIS